MNIFHYPLSIFHSQRAQRAFTLIELMISIALALVLILGINAVFKYTTTAVGQGAAINAATRDSRAAQAVFAGDFSAMVPNGSGANDAACIIIHSSAVTAFRDRTDELSDKGVIPPYNDAKLTIDVNGDGVEGDTNVPGEVISPATYNFRNHRVDCLSFFARDLFPRQTGNPSTNVAPMASQEAWIWYGHLWLPTNNSANISTQYPFDPSKGPLTFPGAGLTSAANPNNYYATQFVLGRVAMLLREPVGGFLYDTHNVSQAYIHQSATGAYAPIPLDLAPLDATSASPTLLDNPSAAYFLEDSRLDLAATSIANFKGKFNNYVKNSPGNFWWDIMMSGNPTPTTPPVPGPNGTRFKCNPFITKPLTSAGLAQSSPYFLAGCTQFIVEYAGDFLVQDSNASHTARGTAPYYTQYGDVTAIGSDGQMDFTVINGLKQVIWYGMPRNTSGRTPTSFVNGDVVPIRDWILYNAYDPTSGGPLALSIPANFFEKEAVNFPYYPDYTSTAGTTTGDSNLGYTAAWGPNDTPPKLIRITITLTDSSGRLPDGLTYQYVFPVPAP